MCQNSNHSNALCRYFVLVVIWYNIVRNWDIIRSKLKCFNWRNIFRKTFPFNFVIWDWKCLQDMDFLFFYFFCCTQMMCNISHKWWSCLIFCVIILLHKPFKVSLYMEHILVCYEIYKLEYSHTLGDHIEPSICVTNLGHGPSSLWGMGCFLSELSLPQPQDQCENVVPQGTHPTCLWFPKCTSFTLHNCQVLVLITSWPPLDFDVMCYTSKPHVNIGHNAFTWFLVLWNPYYICYVSSHTPSLDIHDSSQCKVVHFPHDVGLSFIQPQFSLNYYILGPSL